MLQIPPELYSSNSKRALISHSLSKKHIKFRSTRSQVLFGIKRYYIPVLGLSKIVCIFCLGLLASLVNEVESVATFSFPEIFTWHHISQLGHPMIPYYIISMCIPTVNRLPPPQSIRLRAHPIGQQTALVYDASHGDRHWHCIVSDCVSIY